MRPKPALSLLAFAIVALAACSGSAAAPSAATTPATTPASTPVAVASATASAVAEATPSPVASPSAEPSANTGQTSIDPCTLLRTNEASDAIGKPLGDGVSDQLGPDRVCTFKSGVTLVKLILAPRAADAAAANAYWDAERAQVPAGIPIKDLSVFDRTAYASGSPGGLSLSALFVIDGPWFFDLFCQLPGCSETKSVATAQFIAGRLP